MMSKTIWILCAFGLVGCTLSTFDGIGLGFLAKVDRRRWFRREGWDLPEKVLAALRIPAGARVADIGAGDGYFTHRLAKAVGGEGRVYAVEVSDQHLVALEDVLRRRGLTNVEVVRATSEDPGLPEAGIDLAFLSGVFHHIQEPESYFRQLRRDLSSNGRIAILEGAPDPLHRLVLPFHFAKAADVRRTLERAGYACLESFDFLPILSFQVFVPVGAASPPIGSELHG